LSDFYETQILLTDFFKIFTHQISRKSVLWEWVVPCGQTDMTQIQLLFTVLKNETSNWRFGCMMMTDECILSLYRFI